MARRTIPAVLIAAAIALTSAPTADATLAGAPVVTAKRTNGAGGWLQATPGTFVGGQALSFRGNLGVGGVRTISLQQHMGRPGDQWFAVPGGFSARTNADGSFAFQWVGPDMFNIKFRVVSSGVATPPVHFVAKVQGTDIAVTGKQRSSSSRTPYSVRSGETFGITVDTTPDIAGRPYSRGLSAMPGRTVTLQKRVSPTQWADVASTETDGSGVAQFRNLRETAGPVVYRARQEPLTTGANRIGWIPSHPMYVAVTGGGTNRMAPTQMPSTWDGMSTTFTGSNMARSSGANRTAAGTYKWGKSLYDFAWEFGESLTDAPKKGTGSWSEYADGSGRASKHNGQLTLDSRREETGGVGDFGTTAATLQGNPRTYGRWEQRLRLRSREAGAPGGDYAVRFELVPASNPDDVCRRILVAEVQAHSNTMTFGARNGSNRWGGRRNIAVLTQNTAVFGVEVMPGHVTWFHNGAAIGSVNTSAVNTGVPMTLRMSLVGKGDQEMNQTMAYSDWQRGYSSTTSRAVNGPALGLERAGGCS